MSQYVLNELEVPFQLPDHWFTCLTWLTYKYYNRALWNVLLPCLSWHHIHLPHSQVNKNARNMTPWSPDVIWRVHALALVKQLSKIQKKIHRRPQTVAQIEHKILGTSPEPGHGIPDELEDKIGDKTAHKPRRTQHSRPDGREARRQEDKTKEADTDERQAGRQGRRQEKDKTREEDTASQTRWKRQHGRQDRRQEKDKTS